MDIISTCVEEKLWGSAVRLSAGMLIRDLGALAHAEALDLVQKARVDENALGERFWGAVAEEVTRQQGHYPQ
jgi:hypothetical protein